MFERTGYLIAAMLETAQIHQPQSRREERRAKRRAAILDIAHAEFLKRGYAGTSMSGIATRLGGSKSTLWTYFPTKQSLFVAVLIRAADALEEQLLGSLNLDEGIEHSIHHFCKVYTQIICSPESIALHRLIIAEGVRFPEIGQAFFNCAIGTTREILTTFLTDADQLGMLAIPSPLAAANMLRSLCHGNSFQSLIFNVPALPGTPTIDNDGEVAAAAFLQMFRPAGTAG